MAEAITKRVLVIGWDGADWKVASKLVDEGKMPNLARMIDEGVMGNLSTLYPVLSPMLWTSIATGKRAHKHGIHGFAEPDPQTGGVRPITNLGRKTKAVWNILNQSGKKCNVVGWWPSHPAEPIDGVMVSNHFQSAAGPRAPAPKDGDTEAKSKRRWPVRPGSVHPPQLAERLAKFRMHPREVTPEQILPFVPKAAEVDQEKDRRLGSIAKVVAEITGVHATATALMQHEPWDFMGVYYDGIDHFGHGFMKFHPPKMDWIDEREFELYKNVIETAYVFHDIMLGTLLQLAGDETTVILLSDHGFHPDHLRPRMIGNEPAGPADEHRPYGMLAMCGPGVKRDGLVFGAGLLDITPTILTLFGLPIGRDMDGKPLLDALELPPEVEQVDTWDAIEGADGRHPPDAQIDMVDAAEAMKQLADLGYVEHADEDQQKTVTNTIRELRYNLARDYADARHTGEAIRELQTLWDEFPDESRFGVKLFQCQLQLGRTEEARATLDRLVREKQRYAKEAAEQVKALQAELDGKPEGEIKPDQARKLRTLKRRTVTNPAAFLYFRGSLLHAEGEHEQALAVLKKAEGVQQYNQPSLRQKQGECLLALERWDEAESRYFSMLEVDPINAQAHLGLAQVYLGKNLPKKALEEATSSVGLLYHNPFGHYLAATAESRLGHPKRAIARLQTALAQNIVFPDAQDLMAELMDKTGRTDQAAEHRRQAEAARARVESHRQGGDLPEDADVALDAALTRSLGLEPIGLHEEGALGDDVVVVSGLPRSGTSMMMQVLDAGGLPILTDGQRAADESNQRGYYEFELAKKTGRDNAWLADASGKGVKIVAQLLAGLPPELPVRIVFMQRPLDEVLASQTKMLERLGRDAAKLSQRQLADTYRKQVDRVAQTLAARPAVTLLPVEYHDALADPRAAAARVNRFLGGGLDEQGMAEAIDPSLRREGR